LLQVEGQANFATGVRGLLLVRQSRKGQVNSLEATFPCNSTSAWCNYTMPFRSREVQYRGQTTALHFFFLVLLLLVLLLLGARG
jgi:hypothetical protein